MKVLTIKKLIECVPKFLSHQMFGMEADKPHNCPYPSAGQLMIHKLFYIRKKKLKKIVIFV